jgi:hypothetical protein
MKKKSFAFFALSVVFLCVALVFFFESNVSVGKFLLFFVCGAAAGANLVRGIIGLREAK